MSSGDIDTFKVSLVSLFASIPYNNFSNNRMDVYEGFYASLIYVYLQSLGILIIGEDVTNKGRIDLTIRLNNYIYIMEFKVDDGGALLQIKEKNYHQKYLVQNRQIFLIGIEFDSKERNINKFEWEKVEHS